MSAGDVTARVWLVEAAWGRDKAAFLYVSTIGHQYHFDWTFEVRRALRFGDRNSADLAVMAVRSMRPELFPSLVPMPSYVKYDVIETMDGGEFFAPIGQGTTQHGLPRIDDGALLVSSKHGEFVWQNGGWHPHATKIKVPSGGMEPQSSTAVAPGEN